MSTKKRTPGRGRTPLYNRAAAVAAREAAPVMERASSKPRPVGPPKRRAPQSAPARGSKSAEMGHEVMRGISPDLPGEGTKTVKINKPAMSPWRSKHGKFALGGSAAVGGTAFLFRHHRSKEAAVAKYFDPFSGETVEFGKTDILPTHVRSVTALVPTGRHVADANKLQVFHGKNTTDKTKSPVRRYTK